MTLTRFNSLVLCGVLAFVPRAAHAQQGTVSGTVVVSGSQRPLAGAQVTVQGDPTHGAVSDAGGRFRISGLSGASVTLDARMIGYRPMSQTVNVGTTTVQFVMSERALELDQVVITGTAGGEQKRAIGTSVAQVSVTDVTAKMAVPNVDALLNGRAAGVTILPGSGMVGAGSRVRIRGIGSFSLSADPLIYVDGIRVDNQTGTGTYIQQFSSGVISRLDDFDPDQIESIEVLKGPAAATLYGTEAARGVINIITKKGSTAGGTTYNFTVSGGQNIFQNAAGRIATNYCHVNTPAGGGTPTCDPNGPGPLMALNTVRRQDSLGAPIFRRGALRTYDANVSGGIGIFRYFAAGAINSNEGVDPANEQKKNSFRTNLGITPNDKLNLETNFGYINGRTKTACEAGCGGLMWDSEYSTPANLPQFCPAGNVACTYVQGFNSFTPAADEVQQDWQNLNRITASATISYNPFAWLSNRLAIGTDVTNEDNVEFVPYLTNDTLASFWGSYAKGYRINYKHLVTYNTYDYVGTAKFNLRPWIQSKTSGGVQYYMTHHDSLYNEGDFFPAPGLQTISAASKILPTQQNWTQSNTFGFYGQQEFALNDRLYVTGAVRVDNNSAFGSDVHWVTYPKVSFSYVASEEPRIQQHLPSWLNSLRLRAAYGGSGQQPLLNTALQTLSPVAGPNGAILTPNTIGNPNLKPERVLGTELGFETGMFHDRFGIDFTYFHDDSRDAILSRNVAPGTGYALNPQYFNAGEIVKHGIETLLKGQIMSRRNFGWDMNVNLSTQSAKIIRLNGTDTSISFTSFAHRVGHSPFDWFSYKVISAQGTYDPATNTVNVPAASIMCDNGRGQPTPCYSSSGQLIAPKVYQGHSVPTFEGSWSNTLTLFRNFRLFAMLDAASGYKRLDNNIRIRCQIFYTCLQYVQPEHTDPALLAQFNSAGSLRNFTINDASYLKFRELSLSYDVPLQYVARSGARNATLTVSARNLGFWSRYTGLDPESQFITGTPASVDQAELPQLLTYVVTLRLTY